MKNAIKYTILPIVGGLIIGAFITVGCFIIIRDAIDRRIEAVATPCECVCCVGAEE